MAWGHCCKRRGAGGGRQRAWLAFFLRRRAARRPSMGLHGAELPSPLPSCFWGTMCFTLGWCWVLENRTSNCEGWGCE